MLSMNKTQCIARVRIYIPGVNRHIWTWIRSEFSADMPQHATKFSSATDAAAHIEKLEWSGLVQIEIRYVSF